MRRWIDPRTARRWHLAVFAAGLAISVLMVARSQVTVDQLNLLARGWHLAALGDWVPYGVWATGGGYHPGGATSLLVGLPLEIWPHHRAPVVLILVSHLVAYALLHDTLRRILGPTEQLLFAVLYWLGPWRLFFSGFLWNPNFLFLCGAGHLWTLFRLRERPRFWISFGHVALLGIAVQLHLSAVMLIVASALLWWRRYFRLHLAGAVVAAVVVGVSLVPWAAAMIEAPSRLPISHSEPGGGVPALTPVVQGAMNWLRIAAGSLNRSMATLDFSGLGGPGFDTLRLPALVFRGALAVAAVLVGLFAHKRLWWVPVREWTRSDPAASAKQWLEGVLRWSILASLAVCLLSPIGVSGHGLLSVVHLAVLPVVLWVAPWLTTPRRGLALAGYAALLAVVGVAMALGSPAYRCGGARELSGHFMRMPLVSDHPMLDELGVRETCPLAVDAANGWWPDGLDPLDTDVASRAWTLRDVDTRRLLRTASRGESVSDRGGGGAAGPRAESSE